MLLLRKHWMLGVALCPSILFLNCSDDSINSPTDQLIKIETEYHDGALKFEGFSPEPKVETTLPNHMRAAYYSQIESASVTYINEKKSYNATGRIDFGGYDKGVLPLSGKCPIEFETIIFYMDCEDKNPATKVVKNFNVTEDQFGAQVDGNKNLRLIFCRVDGRLFHPIKQGSGATMSYGLLRLGNMGSWGAEYSHTIDRTFDNEDNNNQNLATGDISPNTMSKYSTTLRISVATSNLDYQNVISNGSGLPSAALNGARFGIFSDSYIGPTGVPSNRGYKVTVDDEDNNNANKCIWDGIYNYVNNSGTRSVSWLIADSNTYFNILYPSIN